MRAFLYLSLATAILSACAAGPQTETEPASKVVQPAKQPSKQATVQPAAQPTATAKKATTLPNILVTPAQNGKGISELQVVQSNPMAKTMMEAINGYLTKKMYDVTSLEGQATLDELVQMQNDIADNSDDISYLASLVLGADVYIKFSGNVKTSAISVDLNAYESSTARLLGSESVMDDDCGGNNQTALMECLHKAAARAMPRLEKKIQAYWEKDQEQGVQYKVIMNIKGEYDEEGIEDLHDDIVQGLKKTFKRVNVNVMTDKTIDLILYADANEYPDTQIVYGSIREMLKNRAKTKKINLTRKLILMDVE